MEQYAVVIAAIVALAVTALSGFLAVPLLQKLKFGQTINELGPSWHKEKKQGTPTMGGLMFIVGTIAGIAVVLPFFSTGNAGVDPAGTGLLALGMFTALAFASIGFLDDYLKVVRKNNLGLREWQKLVPQFLIAAGFLATLHLMGRLTTLVRLPFAGVVDLGFFFYPLSLLVIVGIVNAVNLTDGLDGLASLVTFFVMCGFFVLLMLFERYHLSVWAAAAAGALIGFLMWNFYPAKVFMGDTGSMFLGGTVVAMGYCMGRPDVLIILSIVYLIEAGSVMLQVTYFKLTHGKRLFKMTPIHHSFEKSGWSEVKIDVLFAALTLVCVIVAYIYAVVLG